MASLNNGRYRPRKSSLQIARYNDVKAAVGMCVEMSEVRSSQQRSSTSFIFRMGILGAQLSVKA